ncbi:MAG: hypothetical protein A4E49_00006 [Methanosaeta sp. PtaU1.Bin112]|nr:MAG: hypothetical protein A4E49_00006 [Methanosaeta sp. PtaU1.Bin112]
MLMRIARKLESTKECFIAIEPKDFDGQIYAVDGSNGVVCNWSVANLNQIRAGYVIYKGRSWQKTVLTYDDAFWAHPKNYAANFNLFFQEFFGLEGISLEESDMDRLSSYFRELQEYIALADAIDQSRPSDLILYDGGFDVFKPLRDVLRQVLKWYRLQCDRIPPNQSETGLLV